VPRAGPTRLLGRAWAATSSRWPNMGPTRKPLRPDSGPNIPSHFLLSHWIRSSQTVGSTFGGRVYNMPHRLTPTLTLAALPIPTRSCLHHRWAMASPLPDSLPPPSIGRCRSGHCRALLPWGQGGGRGGVGSRRRPRRRWAVMWPRR
jgi:hypothetical protein